MTSSALSIDEDVRAELVALRHDIAMATEAILGAVERGLEDLSDPTDPSIALRRAQKALHSVLEACAFQDLTGQRLSRVEGLLNGHAGPAADPLLNGPALTGQGLDQAAADALFADMDASNGTRAWPPSPV